MGQIRRQAVRSGLASGLLALVIPALIILAGTTAGARAQDFDPSSLAPEDQARMQQMLESERSHVSRSLPVSEYVFTIVRTETQPRICRYFTLQEAGGDQRQGVGCRVGAGQWQLAATIGAMTEAPVTPAPPATSTDAAPGAVTVLRPAAVDQDAPTAAQPVVSSPALASVPLPGRRPTREIAAATPNTPDETGPDAVALTIPAALAAVPLPHARPQTPSGFASAAPLETETEDRLAESEPPVAPQPPPAEPDGTVAAVESLSEVDLEEPEEVAQGDTGPAPGGGFEAAPIDAPLPAQRP